jgi:HD-GYP domain-containing protein (c-di-GMP phosphodiesterase class II)
VILSKRDRIISDIRNLLRELELHNPSRKGHGERVSSYAVALGYELGIKGDLLQILRWASVVHDAWKLAVPRAVIESPSQIRIEGFFADGISMLKNRYDWVWIKYIEHQYDWYDGQRHWGVENCSDMITQCILVATVFDVLTNHQPWRSAMDEVSAITHMRSSINTQFDPIAFEKFLLVQPIIQPLIYV